MKMIGLAKFESKLEKDLKENCDLMA